MRRRRGRGRMARLFSLATFTVAASARSPSARAPASPRRERLLPVAPGAHPPSSRACRGISCASDAQSVRSVRNRRGRWTARRRDRPGWFGNIPVFRTPGNRALPKIDRRSADRKSRPYSAGFGYLRHDDRTRPVAYCRALLFGIDSAFIRRRFSHEHAETGFLLQPSQPPWRKRGGRVRHGVPGAGCGRGARKNSKSVERARTYAMCQDRINAE